LLSALREIRGERGENFSPQFSAEMPKTSFDEATRRLQRSPAKAASTHFTFASIIS
jgi:hypothetical protein